MAKGNKKALRRAKKREVVKLQKWNRVWENHAADDTNGTHDQWQLDMYEGARTFHQFGQLPAEIRIMILTLAALEGRHLKLRLGKDLLSNSKTAYRFQQCFEAPSILFTTFESRQIALQYHKVHYPIPRPSWALWDDNGYAAAMNHTIDVSLKAELNLDGQQPTRLGKVHFVPFYSNPSSDICTFIPNAHMPFGHALDLVIDFAANMKLSRYVIDVRHMVSASGKDGTAASDVQREAIMSMICYIMLLRKQDPHMALKHIILRCTKTRQASMAALVRHWRQRFVRYEEHKSATAGDDGDVPPVVQTRSSRYPAITCLAWKDAWL